jgi:FtsZ-binding cell division protein ZapB
MDLPVLDQLKAKIEALIRRNQSLLEEKRAIQEQLLLRERQIRLLKERCERYERNQREALERINTLLNKLDGIKP